MDFVSKTHFPRRPTLSAAGMAEFQKLVKKQRKNRKYQKEDKL